MSDLNMLHEDVIKKIGWIGHYLDLKAKTGWVNNLILLGK